MTNSNPYQTPQGEIRVAPELRPGSPLKAIFLGLLTDIGGTTVASFIIGIGYAIMLARQGMAAEEISKSVAVMDTLSPLGLFTVAVGLMFSICGGYVCARIAKRDEYRNCAIQAVMSCGFVFLMKSPPASWAEFIILSLLSIAALFLGAWLALRLNHRERQASAVLV